MKQTYNPHQVIDDEMYQAIYFVENKVIVATMDPTKRDSDTLTIYNNIQDYERNNSDMLRMEIQLDTKDTGINTKEFEAIIEEFTAFRNNMLGKGVKYTKDKPYVRQEINNILDQLNKEGKLRQSVVEQLTYSLKVVKDASANTKLYTDPEGCIYW